MSRRPISEDDLQAYIDGAIDGALDDGRRAEVVAYLAGHPEIARRIEAYRQQRQDLRAALRPVAEEPVPPELDLARMIAARHGPRGRTAWPRPWLGAAAALLLIAFGGLGGWSLNDALQKPDRVALGGGIAALAMEAADSYAVYAADRIRPVELRASDRAELVAWAAQRLQRPVAVPDLSAAGYRFMGGRLVATAHGPAVLFMYDDDQGTRLVMLSRPMSRDRDAPMAPSLRGRVAGFTWGEKGIGYSLVGPLAPESLHPLADDIRRQVGQAV